MLPLLIAGAALETYGQLKAGSAARRAADNRATALKAQAARRLTQGKQQAGIITAQGGMSQTSELAAQSGRGLSREDIQSNGSLDEIAGRAKYASDQALEQAQLDSQSILEDAGAVSQEGRNAQEASTYGAAGSILGTAGRLYGAKYGY